MPSRTPNMFLVGAPRCGTTALYTYLKAHPDVFTSRVKELHYFSTDFYQPDPQGAFRTEREYLAMFAAAGDQPWVGSLTVLHLLGHCIYSATAPEAIKNSSREADRHAAQSANMMYSMYSFRVRAAAFRHPAREISRTFEQALADGPARLRGERLPPGVPTEPGRRLYPCYQELGRYADRLGVSPRRVPLKPLHVTQEARYRRRSPYAAPGRDHRRGIKVALRDRRARGFAGVSRDL